MEIRETERKDLAKVLELYDQARSYMREHGNHNQWVNGYPSQELILQDIAQHTSYVCTDQDEMVGVFTFIRGMDPTYGKIYDGAWLDELPYGVIHRIASSSHKKGVASFCIDWCYAKCHNIRIDTHEDNYIMQNLLKKQGFIRCGIIYLESGAPRIAYQKPADTE